MIGGDTELIGGLIFQATGARSQDLQAHRPRVCQVGHVGHANRNERHRASIQFCCGCPQRLRLLHSCKDIGRRRRGRRAAHRNVLRASGLDRLRVGFASLRGCGLACPARSQPYGRAAFISGDVFEDTPGGFDTMHFKNMLHNWDNAYGAVLFAHCGRALG